MAFQPGITLGWLACCELVLGQAVRELGQDINVQQELGVGNGNGPVICTLLSRIALSECR